MRNVRYELNCLIFFILTFSRTKHSKFRRVTKSRLDIFGVVEIMSMLLVVSVIRLKDCQGANAAALSFVSEGERMVKLCKKEDAK